VSIRKWLGSKIAGVDIEGIQRHEKYLQDALKDNQKDYRKLVEENRFMKNQFLFGAPSINLSRDNIITLRHRMLVKENELYTTEYIVEGFKKTILDNKFYSCELIKDEATGQTIMDMTLRLIRP
jgi:hypothetical protein